MIARHPVVENRSLKRERRISQPNSSAFATSFACASGFYSLFNRLLNHQLEAETFGRAFQRGRETRGEHISKPVLA